MKLLQLNLNHCSAAQELLCQTVIEEDIDIAILSEPYKTASQGTWISGKKKQLLYGSMGSSVLLRNLIVRSILSEVRSAGYISIAVMHHRA